jgi:hypothetical protein
MEYYKPAIMEEMGIGSDMEYERQAARTIDGIEELLPVLLPNDAWVRPIVQSFNRSIFQSSRLIV